MIAALVAVVALVAAPPTQHDWTRFGLTAARQNASPFATGITASNAFRLQRQRVELDGTVDSSPIYLHDVTIGGAKRNAFFVTTTYGKTIAVDAATGRILWRVLPPRVSPAAL